MFSLPSSLVVSRDCFVSTFKVAAKNFGGTGPEAR